MAYAYSPSFYRATDATSSAEIILPIVLDIVKPASVVDAGCGVGLWLSIAKRLGVSDHLGFEGEWILNASRHPDKPDICVKDLEKDLAWASRFDMAMCLEVAEHLSETRAASFVRDLCRLSDVVLFSAAIPGQGGTNHINEQWQSYWADLFGSQGYVPYDVVRPRVWTDDRVYFWYRQNMLLYVNRSNAQIMKGYEPCSTVNMVHPELYSRNLNCNYGIRQLVSELPAATVRSFKSRIRSG